MKHGSYNIAFLKRFPRNRLRMMAGALRPKMRWSIPLLICGGARFILLASTI